MTSGQQVIVVDGVPETAQVLREVFEPRGHRVERLRSFELSAAKPASGSVLVIHDDGSESQRRFKYGAAPRVIVGSMTIAAAAPSDSHEHCLAQPFHYAELIRAVERLLADDAPHRAAA